MPKYVISLGSTLDIINYDANIHKSEDIIDINTPPKNLNLILWHPKPMLNINNDRVELIIEYYLGPCYISCIKCSEGGKWSWKLSETISYNLFEKYEEIIYNNIVDAYNDMVKTIQEYKRGE